jgi:predicted solute-binding protein
LNPPGPSTARIGSVAYLNAAPLTRGLEAQTRFLTPARLAVELARGELDAALVSVTEPLLTGCYDLLDGVGIIARGEVYSVFLAHRRPVEEVTEIFCDPASLTSVNLLKVLLAERGLRPQFRPLPDYATAAQHDYVLLIGDPAIAFQRAPHDHAIFDLGRAWWELTGRPFVFAGWALRRGLDPAVLANLKATLRAARARGQAELAAIIRERPEFDAEFRREYFARHIYYELGAEERAGLAEFARRLERHGLGPVHAPVFAG